MAKEKDWTETQRAKEIYVVSSLFSTSLLIEQSQGGIPLVRCTCTTYVTTKAKFK
jgi:outer membrane biogenesis lipoprotein LolB